MDNSVIEYQRSSWNAVKDRLGAGEALYIGDMPMSPPVSQQLNNQAIAISTSTLQEAEETTGRNGKTTMIEEDFFKMIEDWENELIEAEEKKKKSGLEKNEWKKQEVIDKAIKDEEILWNRAEERMRKKSEPDDEAKDLNISNLQRVEEDEGGLIEKPCHTSEKPCHTR